MQHRTADMWGAVARRVRNRPLIALMVAVLAALLFALAAASLRERPHVPPPRDAVVDARFAAAVARVGSARYTASPLEMSWARGARVRAGALCAAIAAEQPLWQRWLDVAEAARSGVTAMPASTAADADIWSEMTVTLPGHADAVVRLEPLAGFLRDPRTSCPRGVGLSPGFLRGVGDGSAEDSKGFVLLDPVFYRALASALQSPPPPPPRGSTARAPRALLFDIGSSGWQSVPLETGLMGLSWLVDSYARVGIEFDAVYAWEAARRPARDYFADMPLRLAARTHFYNIPVAAGGGGLNDALAVLRDVAAPGDFVVFKIDIDAAGLEESIVLTLIEDASVGSLVDDFFFEHHVHNAVMRVLGWGDVDLRDVHDSIALFQALRRHGIRAHSWP